MRDPKKRCVTFYLDKVLDEKVEKMAKHSKKFKWAIIEEAVEQYLKNQ